MHRTAPLPQVPSSGCMHWSAFALHPAPAMTIHVWPNGCVWQSAQTGLDLLLPLQLWNDRQREIIPIAAFVAGLEVVAVDRDNRAVGQVTEGAADWVGARVADQGES